MGLLSGIDNATGWTVLQKNSAQIEKAYEAEGSAKTDIEYFRKVAPSLDTPEKLLKNYRALKFVTTAYGLGDQVNQTALLRKLLTENPAKTSSLAQQLADERYRNFAAALSTWAPPPFSNKSTVEAAVAGFKRQSFETSIGKDSVALQEATYFSRSAKGVTKLSQLMSDKVLLDVVVTALGIPAAFKGLDYTQQVNILKPRVDLKQFATAEGVSKFVDKYLAMEQLKSGNSGGASSPITGLFNGGGGGGLTLNAKLLAPRALNVFA